jgi:uncharacterized phage infection (PIP) family protein YhgE
MPVEDEANNLVGLLWIGAIGWIAWSLWIVLTLNSMRDNLSKIASSVNQQVLLLKKAESRESQASPESKTQNNRQSQDVAEDQPKEKPEPVVPENPSGYDKSEKPLPKLSPKEVQAERAKLLNNREKRDENEN